MILRSYASQEEEILHLRKGLNMICNRIGQIAVPNGTTKVLDRIAAAALTGTSLEEAAARHKGN